MIFLFSVVYPLFRDVFQQHVNPSDRIILPYDHGMRSSMLEEGILSPEAETFRDVGSFVVKAGIRYAASFNPYTAAAVLSYHVYDTIDEWILSSLPEWATNPEFN